MEGNKSTNFLRVKCHACGKEQVIFGRASTEVKCIKCSEVIVVPRGGKASIKAEILELV